MGPIANKNNGILWCECRVGPHHEMHRSQRLIIIIQVVQKVRRIINVINCIFKQIRQAIKHAIFLKYLSNDTHIME